MANKLIIKTQLHGARRIKFERLIADRDESVSYIMREIIDFYFKNQSETEGSNTTPSK